ncbi:MAG TPA: CaiB/BaiF CoA-transferase family protein [Acidimicrobiales bacterium]|nr:CaiB/BaiF CoA-transferase family protein [Acidimicrobiales bacterium]
MNATAGAPGGVKPLDGVRVVESSMLGPAEMGGLLADLGADVIKVEPPGGDYGRRMTWPIIRSQDRKSESSLLSLHINRGKRSIVLDLRQPEGVQAYLDLVRQADAVIEAMRPGALAKRGLTMEKLWEANPALVFCSISGYGATGPYRDMPSHGIAYDTWAGQVPVEVDEHGYTVMGEHTSVGIHAGPLYGALAILAAVIRARSTGQGCAMEVAQSDAAAYFDWYRIETWKGYERPEDEVYGNAADHGERRAPGIGGMRGGVRYQIYATADGHVLFMASEQAFWKNFCTGIDRTDLFERWPGTTYGDHARGNLELQAILTEVFRARSSAEWIAFGNEHNTPIAPVNTPKTILEDPQFRHRMRWLPKEDVDADMMAFPVKIEGGDLPAPGKAPAAGQHSEEVLREVAGYDDARVAALRDAGVLG